VEIMSRDVSVNCHTCGSVLNHGKGSLPAGCDGLLEALGAPVSDWKGRTGVTVLPNLAGALRMLKNEEDDLREKHDKPGDPWSRVDFVGPFLQELLWGICTDPQATISVWP
jgi:hypothetical protein